MRVALMLVTVPVIVNAAVAKYGQYDPGCVVEEEKEVSWHWSGAEVVVWAPPHTQEDILTVSITYQNYQPPQASDRIAIKLLSAFMESRHPNGTKTTKTVDFTTELASGWVQLKLTLDATVTVASSGPNRRTLLTLPVPLHVKSLHLRGSNLTLNCQQGTPAWLVSGGRRAVVPLAAGVEKYPLTLLSRSVVQPSLTLANQVWRLGWTGTELTVAEENLPLPPHHHHQLSILCSSDGFRSVRCCLVAGENKEELLDMMVAPAWPTVLTVRVEDGQSLVVYTATVAGGEAGGLDGSDQEAADTNSLLVVLVLMVVVVVAVVVVVLIGRRRWLQGEGRRLLGMRRGEVGRRWEMEDLRQSSSEGAFTDDPLVCGKLWAAVAGGIKEEVEELLSTLRPDPRVVPPGRDTSAYTEAHFRGNSEVLAAIHAHTKHEMTLPTDDVVEEVLKVYERRVKEVFEASERGQYHDHGGVDLLLRGYGLPGTVRDHKGFSLLHHAAKARLPWRKTSLASRRSPQPSTAPPV
ncbi:uncharacterized protein [Panulirus ornatus]|uniref:uncharacterized protein isoform X1 n=1 Tax=Panulirus ornatus TaxID=150431 RepID=UPI003A89E8F1